MRIDWLEIRSPWKNLKGFRIDLDQSRDVTVLLGRNGSAKSNLLEAFITIFRNLDLGEPAAFSYEIGYDFNGHKVVLNAETDKQPRGEVDRKTVSLSDIRWHWTPRHVVGYYSGVSDRFEELFRKHDREALKDTFGLPQITGDPGILDLRRFICARPVHSLFALLAFYFADDVLVENFLTEFPRIEGFDSALLVVRKPVWAKPGSKSRDFWDAKGPVRDLLERIRRHSLAPFTRSVRVEVNFPHKETRELIYLYLPDLKALRAFSKEYDSNPKALFQALDTMRLSELIEDFRVRVRVSGSSGAIHTRQLSEGEQQLLTVLGLMRFTKDEESLYILDEPDTHLNPAWGLEYLDRLRKIGGIDSKSHTILATHDPLLVAGLCRQEIRLLTRTASGSIVASMPEDSPRGRGVAGVLTSPIYGLDSQLDQFSLRVLNRMYQVSFWERSTKRTRHLMRLRRLVPALETEESSPDPYRNIARDAYRIAQDHAISADKEIDKKKVIVRNLAEYLYEQASKVNE